MKWYRRAAEQGDAAAQNNLAICYENGQGVEQDNEEAVKWYRKAAEQDYFLAQVQLIIYYFHLGGDKGNEEMKKWCERAINNDTSIEGIDSMKQNIRNLMQSKGF